MYIVNNNVNAVGVDQLISILMKVSIYFVSFMVIRQFIKCQFGIARTNFSDITICAHVYLIHFQVYLSKGNSEF